MKIGLISRGRTQSSAIIASLAHNYQLINLSEIYFSVFPTVNEVLKLKEKISRKTQEPIETFKEKVINLTEKNFLHENFIIKLWPSMLTFLQFNINNYNNNIVFNKIKENIIFNITDYWKIKNYDKLYFLDRNLNDSLYSWVYCKNTRYFQNYKNIISVTPIIELKDKDIQLAKKYILEYCLQQQLKEFLITNNINFENVIDRQLYINNDILRIQPMGKEYRTLIKNIEELDKLIQEWYPVCLEYTNDWNFY